MQQLCQKDSLGQLQIACAVLCCLTFAVHSSRCRKSAVHGAWAKQQTVHRSCPLLRQARCRLPTVLVYVSSLLSSLKQGVRMWLLSKQLLSPYTAMRPLWKAVRPRTACKSPDAAVPKRPTNLVVPAFNARLSQPCTQGRQDGFSTAVLTLEQNLCKAALSTPFLG